MEIDEPIIVRRGGFMSALVYGFFGTVCVVVLCGTAVAIYGMKMVNGGVSDFMSLSPQIAESLLQWQDALPPAVSDALDDQRALEYIEQIDTSIELVRDFRSNRQYPVIEVTNRGESLISLMSLRVIVEDAQGLPVHEVTTYAATPLAIENDWRGPLLPGGKRRFRIESLHSAEEGLSVSVEVSDLRIWNENKEEAEDHGLGLDLEVDLSEAEQPELFLDIAESTELKTLPIEAETDSEIPDEKIESSSSEDESTSDNNGQTDTDEETEANQPAEDSAQD